MNRSAGVLLHISSLPSKCGIGTLGEEAYKFADFLKKLRQKYWQVLPVGQTGFGDSPYQSVSSYAGNPYFIDFDLLKNRGLLKKEDYENLDWGSDVCSVDYGKIFEYKFKVLKIAYERSGCKQDEKFLKFKNENEYWLKDYSLYMALKNYFNMKSWVDWDEDIKFRKPDAIYKYSRMFSDEIEFYSYIQYLFFLQWNEFKYYVNSLGVSLIGDMPIYVAMDSVDAWANPRVFWFDKNNNPVCVAGCPPDDFSKTGQLWGNPLYNWEYLKNTNYNWWIKRLKHAKKLFDVLRIDHFRGFEAYYAVEASAVTAENGRWLKGPGMDFLNCVKNKLPDMKVIAEDLGFLTDSAKKMLRDSGYPGMKILEFAFSGEDSDYLPHNYIKNSVVYTGNHDNDTILGWFDNLNDQQKEFVRSYSKINDEDDVNWELIRLAYSSVSKLVIIPMQDLLGLNSKFRMNEPSTVGQNWKFRIKSEWLNEQSLCRLKTLTEIYFRCN